MYMGLLGGVGAEGRTGVVEVAIRVLLVGVVRGVFR